MIKRNALAPVVEFTDQAAGTVRYLEHGSPSKRIHWHLHDDYELHLIVRTQGKVFVGDYLGPFRPGQLILTGPGLPHNWITTTNEAVDIRDMVLHFSPTVMTSAMQALPELIELKPMLERSRSGLEFEGIDLGQMKRRFQLIRDAQRLERLHLFLELMHELSRWPNYRLLSTVQVVSAANEHAQKKVSAVIDYVMEHYAQPITLNDAAQLVNMTDTYFSRFFRQSTGHRFVDLVNRVRISRACSLLVETDQNITTICYTVGFNNVANFNRRFQELKGVTPRTYRKTATVREVEAGSLPMPTR
ncbi:MAG: AraC family transcriptional regulator [Saccharospirillum sp.]|nr:AraC family transcriptional regulator [Saccharospirillum sp.]